MSMKRITPMNRTKTISNASKGAGQVTSGNPGKFAMRVKPRGEDYSGSQPAAAPGGRAKKGGGY